MSVASANRPMQSISRYLQASFTVRLCVNNFVRTVVYRKTLATFKTLKTARTKRLKKTSYQLHGNVNVLVF
jgi:hypothetical protein